MSIYCCTCRFITKDLFCWQPELATVDYDYYGGAHCRQADPRIVNDEYDCIFFEERQGQAGSMAGVGMQTDRPPPPEVDMGLDI